MIIRTFHPTDAEAVVNLWQACKLTRPWNNPQLDIQRKLSVKDNLFLVGIRNEKIVGSVMGGYEGHRGWINYLAIDPALRRQGLGLKLMRDVEARLLALGCPKVNLLVREGNNEVMAFYESIGFSDDKCTAFGKRLIPDI